jgi:eukaryotic-like serine/threonine-protein kinase
MPDEPTGPPRKLGKYEIRREIGRGGMGVVYEGYDPIICRRVALKTLVSELFQGTEAEAYLARLQREAQAAGRLSHPNIVAVYDFGEEPLPQGSARLAFIAMEFVEGRGLNSYLSAGERFPLSTVVRIMVQLLDALEYSHKNGVVHRDIKPGNIIVLADGTVKVADFGIARIESSTLTQAGTVMGSPSYMSPEQFLGQTVDGRSDLYSAGVVLYELLTGEVPFAGSFSNVMHKVLNDPPSPVSVLNVSVPKCADVLLGRALAKRPAERFQTAADFKQALLQELAAPTEAATAPHALPASAATATVLHAAPTRPRRTATFIAAACVLAVALGSALLYRHSRPGAPAAAPAAAARVAATVGSAATGAAALAKETSTAPGTAVITAIGLADPEDPRFAKGAAPLEQQLWGDARGQLIEKAVALYVDPKSITANYALLRDKLFSRSDAYISTVLEQTPPQRSQYGLMSGTMRATVKVHDVQKSLNEIARAARVAFIRNNGNPTIAVEVSAVSDPAGAAAQRSQVAENILMDRIRSFGFVAVDEPHANPPPDFLLNSEVRFKHLSATLPASGLTIEKVALTSWTVRAIDNKSGEEVYLNTQIPEKKSWASEELALQDVGRLIGAQFSRDFFLQYFSFGSKRVRLNFVGLPREAASSVLGEANAAVRVLNASLVDAGADQVAIDVDLSGGSDSAQDLIEGALLEPLNRKLGRPCFASQGADGTQLRITYAAACNTAPLLGRLEHAPPAALIDAPQLRLQDIVSDPARLQPTTL